MKKQIALAATCLFLMVGAAYPDAPKRMDAADAAAGDTSVAPATYRACRPGPGDDRCIQLYERGMRSSYARWREDRAPAPVRQEAVAGVRRDAGGVPTESALRRMRSSVNDDNCTTAL